MASERGETSQVPSDPGLVEKLVLLLVNVRSRQDVMQAAMNAYRLSEGDALRLVAEAERKISLASSVDYDAELGRAVTRLDDLYAKSVQQKDTKVALAVQRERARMLGLNREKGMAAVAGGGGDDHVLAELAATRAHLAGLVPHTDDDPTDEIARRVVELFVTQTPKKKRRT